MASVLVYLVSASYSGASGQPISFFKELVVVSRETFFGQWKLFYSVHDVKDR